MSLDQLEAFTIEPTQAAGKGLERPGGLAKGRKARRSGDPRGPHREQDRQQQARQVRRPRAYRQAGGAITSDLFAKEDAGYITDLALLHKLVAEKLEAAAAPLREEGWKFVDVWHEQPENHWDYGRLRPNMPTRQRGRRDQEDRNRGREIQKEHGEEPEDEDAYNRLWRFRSGWTNSAQARQSGSRSRSQCPGSWSPSAMRAN